MKYSKVIVCLANSRKPGGSCVAGKEYFLDKQKNTFSIGSWVRPVSQRETREISSDERRYKNGGFADNLDIINISFTGADKHVFQSENELIDAETRWIRSGGYNKDYMECLLDSPQQLWLNGYDSSSGTNDRVPEQQLQGHVQSLYFIMPKDLYLTSGCEGKNFGDNKKTLRAHFSYNNVQYGIKVTDPELESVYFARGEGEYHDHGIRYLTVSLGEFYNGFAYKLIAAGFK